jgi:hypothetical protein
MLASPRLKPTYLCCWGLKTLYIPKRISKTPASWSPHPATIPRNVMEVMRIAVETEWPSAIARDAMIVIEAFLCLRARKSGKSHPIEGLIPW